MRVSPFIFALCAAHSLAASLEPLRRALCNADNCLRAVRGNANPSKSATEDCSKYLTDTITPTTTRTVTELSVTTSTPTATSTTVSISLFSQTSTVPSTTTLSTVTVTTLSTASVSTVTTTATVTSPLPNNAPGKRQVAASSIPPYASACSSYARYSSACSCIGVFATTVTTSGPVTTTTVLSTTTASTSTSVSTMIMQSTTAITVTSGVVTITSFTSTSTTTLYTTTNTVTTQASAVQTVYSFTLNIIYPADQPSNQIFFGVETQGNLRRFYRTPSSSGQPTFVLDPSTGHVTLASNGQTLLYAASSSGSIIYTGMQGSTLTCSIGASNQLICTENGVASALAICNYLFISPGSGDPVPANCAANNYHPITLQAVGA